MFYSNKECILDAFEPMADVVKTATGLPVEIVYDATARDLQLVLYTTQESVERLLGNSEFDEFFRDCEFTWPTHQCVPIPNHGYPIAMWHFQLNDGSEFSDSTFEFGSYEREPFVAFVQVATHEIHPSMRGSYLNNHACKRTDPDGLGINEGFAGFSTLFQKCLLSCLLDACNNDIEFLTGEHRSVDLARFFASKGRYFFHELNKDFQQDLLQQDSFDLPIVCNNTFGFLDNAAEYVKPGFMGMSLERRLQLAVHKISQGLAGIY